MTGSDLSRVREARERLHAADAHLGLSDPAIRIVELQSPRLGERSLVLDRAFCVITGLASGPRQALAATVDAIRTNNENIGLSGIVETYGRRFPMHKASSLAPKVPGTDLVPTGSLFNRAAAYSAEAKLVLEVIDTVDRAILLSGAELRGADAAAADLEIERAVLTNSDSGSAVGATLVVRTEDEEMLEALDMVAPPVTAIEELRKTVARVREDGTRTRLEARVSQTRAAREQVLPSDSNDVTVLADLAIAEADGALAEYDMTPGSPTERLTSQLADLGFQTAPFEAAEVADRLISESHELETIRQRLVRSIESAALPPAVVELETRRHQIDERRLRIRRQMRSHQQLLAVMKQEARRLGVDVDGIGVILDLRDERDRPFPILIEEPLAGLPARMAGSILSILLRYSNETQVLCVSDQLDLHDWCESVGERADWVRATGWFAGRSST